MNMLHDPYDEGPAANPAKNEAEPNREITRIPTESVYHTRTEPVAPEALAAAGGIKVINADFAPVSEELSNKVFGFCHIRPRRSPAIAILLNTRFAGKRMRFTFAHELAHAAHAVAGADRGGAKPRGRAGTSRDSCERLCDRIAAEVLMPADLVLSDVLEAGRVNSYTLARRFGVSLTAMRVRLRGLGLL